MAYPGRCTPDQVLAIIYVDPAITDITPFIDIMNELVTEICVPAGYSDHRLMLIEIWGAAHFCAIRDTRTSLEKAGDTEDVLPAKIDFGFKNTTYGQQAMRLDTNGGLAVLDNAADKYAKMPAAIASTIGGFWAGKRIRRWPYNQYPWGC